MTQPLRIVMAQINTLVGDIEGNTDHVIAASLRARDEMRADAIVFPELTLTGYPPEDLLLRPGLSMVTLRGFERVKRDVTGIDVIIGYPQKETGGLFNVASVIRDGQLKSTYHKQHLPNYSVFDEKRYFVAGEAKACVVDIKGVPVGITVCEDLWMPDPVQQAAKAGARLILNLNASPYHINKHEEREAILYERANESALPIVYVNLVGGQDELVFDGGSTVVNAQGEITQRAPVYETGLYVVDFNVDAQGQVTPLEAEIAPVASDEASVYGALVLGVRDYVEKNGFRGVVIGLSGGIDSALTLALAADALGAAHVHAVMMPSRHTSELSLELARQQADMLKVAYREISIEPAFEALLASLEVSFEGCEAEVTEGNRQGRVRGNMLMALSKKVGWMVLATGNKSELAVGYSTIYGDMCGGFSPLRIA